MIYIFTGTDLDKAQIEYLNKKLETEDSLSIETSEINKVSISQITEEDLFKNKPINIFIQDLYSLKDEFEIIKIISESDLNFYTFEKSKISPKFISNFKKLKIYDYKLPLNIFSFIDGVKPGSAASNIKLFNLAIKTSPIELVFFMLTQRIRVLIALKLKSNITEVKSLSDWQETRIRSQANLFDFSKLKQTYSKLVKIDNDRKSGISDIDLKTQIDFLLLKI